MYYPGISRNTEQKKQTSWCLWKQLSQEARKLRDAQYTWNFVWKCVKLLGGGYSLKYISLWPDWMPFSFLFLTHIFPPYYYYYYYYFLCIYITPWFPKYTLVSTSLAMKWAPFLNSYSWYWNTFSQNAQRHVHEHWWQDYS